MKLLLTTLTVLAMSFAFGQRSETLIPQEAFSVFSVNNIHLLQKVSLDELVQYEFMEEIQQELFDGSTSGKTIKDSGIDFDQKLNIFVGRGENYDVTGLTFGINDRSKFFEVFDDFEAIESDYEGVDFYTSYFNRIAIKGDAGILFRVIPRGYAVSDVTDSIWYARGNGYPWYNEHYWGEDYYNEWEYEEGFEGEIEFIEEMETEENTTTPIEESENLPEAADDPTEKTYLELRDSVELAMQNQFLKRICDDIFIDGNTLYKTSPEFKSQIESTAEGTFYMDNSKGFQSETELDYMRRYHPIFYSKLENLYTGNLMFGEIRINEKAVDLQLNTEYGDELGSIYKELTNTKFDKNVIPYIHKDNQAFFTYNLNMREAYEKAYEVMMPILSDSDNRNMAGLVLTIELLDEYVNKDAVFDSYKGSVFGTFNGVQKIKTTKFVWEHDEETFEYTEKEVEAEEDMAIFVVGFSTGRNDIMEKIMRFNCKMYSAYHDMGGYYMVDNAILNTAPLYIINKNGLFIYTNDEKLAKKNSNGYGSDAISKKTIKKAMKGGAVYAHADLSKAVEDLPKEVFNSRENELIDVIRGKSGTIELTSTKTTTKGTSFNLSYEFEGEYENSGTYILDLINSIYVISK